MKRSLQRKVKLILKVEVLADLIKQVRNTVLAHVMAVVEHVEADVFPVLSVRSAESLVEMLLPSQLLVLIRFIELQELEVLFLVLLLICHCS